MIANYKQSLFLFLFVLAGCTGKKNNSAHHDRSDTIAAQVNSPARIVVSSQNTVRPALIKYYSGIQLKGIITPDITRNNKISIRAGGRIEKLYTKFEFKYVAEGSPLMELYSPEINSVAEEYLLLNKTSSDTSLLKSSYKRLRLLGLTDSQIRALEKNQKVPLTFTVFSPYSGYLLPLVNNNDVKGMNVKGKNGGMEGMGAAQAKGQTFEATAIREGAYVNEGQTLFLINDLQYIWVMLTIEPGTAVTKGDSVNIHYGSRKSRGVIDFVEPYIQEDQKFSRARVSLKNDGTFKVNDILTAELKPTGGLNVVTVPRESVLDLGHRKMVWVKRGKEGKSTLFESRFVTTGRVLGEQIEITDGLDQTDEIARVAGLLLDSESFIEK